LPSQTQVAWPARARAGKPGSRRHSVCTISGSGGTPAAGLSADDGRRGGDRATYSWMNLAMVRLYESSAARRRERHDLNLVLSATSLLYPLKNNAGHKLTLDKSRRGVLRSLQQSPLGSAQSAPGADVSCQAVPQVYDGRVLTTDAEHDAAFVRQHYAAGKSGFASDHTCERPALPRTAPHRRDGSRLRVLRNQELPYPPCVPPLSE
jgi:hypothetical protein